MLWLCVIASLLVLAVSLILAIDDAGDIAENDACHLGMEFEVESVRTLDTSWFPPTATCEYTLLGRQEVERETRWGVYFPVVPLTGLAMSLLGLRAVHRSDP